MRRKLRLSLLPYWNHFKHETKKTARSAEFIMIMNMMVGAVLFPAKIGTPALYMSGFTLFLMNIVNVLQVRDEFKKYIHEIGQEKHQELRQKRWLKFPCNEDLFYGIFATGATMFYIASIVRGSLSNSEQPGFDGVAAAVAIGVQYFFKKYLLFLFDYAIATQPRSERLLGEDSESKPILAHSSEHVVDPGFSTRMQKILSLSDGAKQAIRNAENDKAMELIGLVEETARLTLLSSDGEQRHLTQSVTVQRHDLSEAKTPAM